MQLSNYNIYSIQIQIDKQIKKVTHGHNNKSILTDKMFIESIPSL